MADLTREDVADVLARVYDGQPLDQLRDEHAAHHLEAADALLARLSDPAARVRSTTEGARL
ncbi:hypothetical protein [Streptomyces prasinopilosus]|uniref:hypothetical protein n=1 Tax=Streptomyces prasinopilosus TaxID=67344 RepID=UPI0006EB35C9|nr:hypothetical protein [Streptomyces prasinopilosus]